MERAIQELEADLGDLERREIELRELRDEAAEQMSAIEQRDALASQRRRFEQHRAQIVAAIDEAIGRPVHSNDSESIRCMSTTN